MSNILEILRLVVADVLRPDLLVGSVVVVVLVLGTAAVVAVALAERGGEGGQP